jgi:tRNA1Val (adenine37-N6)-methyltransferase
MKVTTDSCFFGAWVAEEIKNSKSEIQSLLDIGTGTGLLSLMTAQKNDVDIDTVEIDIEAATQAKENIDASPWKNRIHVFNENILSFHAHKKYDCIICNPPFYENELSSDKQNKNIAHHSKQLTIEQVLNFIKKNLQQDGIFFLLFPFKREEAIASMLFQQELFITKKVVLKQTDLHQPFRVVIRGTNKRTGIEDVSIIAIRDEHQAYTKVFTHFLQEYYLYL